MGKDLSFFQPQQPQTFLDYFQEIYSQYENKEITIKELIAEIQKHDLQLIIETADINDNLHAICQSDEINEALTPFLSKDKVGYLKKALPLNIAIPYLHPLEKISTFDLIAGLYFYNKAFVEYLGNNKVANSNILENLHTAMKHHSFQAVELYCNIEFNRIIANWQNLDSPLEDYMAMLEPLIELAPYYGTPIYIALAEYHLSMAIKLSSTKIDDAPIYHHGRTGLKYLVTAQQLEISCQAEIHNAYFGDGLASGNCLGFSDIQSMIKAYMKKMSFSNETLKRAQTDASPLVQKYRTLCQTTDTKENKAVNSPAHDNAG